MTQALYAKQFYKKPKKRVGLMGTLILTNVAWVVCLVFLTGILWTNTQIGAALTSFYIQERERWEEVRKSKERELAQRNLEVARMVAFQTSSPGDIVRLASKISTILNSAKGARREFLEEAVPQAIRLQVQRGIPASAVLSMAIYESNYGQSMLSSRYNNYFGIKAFRSWKGPRAYKMPTVDSGVRVRADFRAYPSLWDGFQGYADFLQETGRYSKAFYTDSGPSFVKAVLQAGYCPDGDYHGNILRIMARHHLLELDDLIEQGEDSHYQKALIAHNKSEGSGNLQ